MKSLKAVVTLKQEWGHRLLEKFLKKLGNKTLLEIHLSRALQSGLASESIIMPVNWPE